MAAIFRHLSGIFLTLLLIFFKQLNYIQRVELGVELSSYTYGPTINHVG